MRNKEVDALARFLLARTDDATTRRLVALAQRAAVEADGDHTGTLAAVLGAQMTMMLEVLRVLASVYADDPEYLEAWRPWSEMQNTAPRP